MIKIGILGDIGSGKSYVAKSFGYPVFNADHEVSKLYKKNKSIKGYIKKIEEQQKTIEELQKNNSTQTYYLHQL